MADIHENRRRALSFGALADDYDRLRPRYAAQTIAAIVDGVSTAADIGAGTGILARQLRDAGVDVLVVEPDSAMLEVARNSGLDAEQATFETWDADGRTFDLITFGQSFHWVDPDVAVPRLAELAAPGGRVALLWNKLRPVRPSSDDLSAASEDYLGLDAVRSDPTRDAAILARLHDRFAAVGFTTTVREDTWTESQPADRWLDLIFTYSAHSTLPADRRARMRAALSQVIGDADVELSASTIAVLATRG